LKRYRAVFDKAVPSVQNHERLSVWNQVKKCHLLNHAAWLDGESHAYRTEFLEITTLNQSFNFWIDEGHLPAECRIRLSMDRPTDTDTYCYKTEEVAAMIQHCREDEGLRWLGNVITALSYTGMRISELEALRWPDIDLSTSVIKLTDDSRGGRRKRKDPRTLKSKRGRSFPIHKNLKSLLESLRARDAQGRVFRGPKGNALRADRVWTALIKKVLMPLEGRFPSSEEEIGFKDGRLHSLRHFFVSECANAGIPEAAVMTWLGHRASAMVRYYYHLHDKEAQRQIEKLSFC
jgi:integrase